MAQRRRRAGLRDGRRRGRNQWGPLPASAYSDTPDGPIAARGKRRAWPWIVLALLLAAMVPVGYFGYPLVSTMFAVSKAGTDPNTGNNVPLNIGVAPKGTVMVLLMGSDERHDKNGNIVSGDVPHSDTMILVAVDTDRRAVRMLSVPRDLLVTIPGFGAGHRINEAYTLGEVKHVSGGGPGLAVRTMEQLIGFKIPYYGVITFDGFRQGVDAAGGVTVDVERPITDHDYPGDHYDLIPVYIPAGRQLLDGERSLEYVRSRHDDPQNDFGRNQRQQHFLTALSNKMLRPERLGQFAQFLDIIKNNLRTNLSPAEMLALGNSMVGTSKPRFQTYAVGPDFVRPPTAREAALYGAVLIPNKKAIDSLVQAFLRGDPAPGGASPSPSGA
ncbi:MAG: polyisoprenyl-teichoic acid--peptidoglycan teichoic acid transferase [Chloroflexota bacterium]|jgi:LCP family protein required for cell wall assembly|nr:polyisoprenyl-teichoic acid--peptidoglycan teichoic acid transferase [Chloroflexota bacterium]